MSYDKPKKEGAIPANVVSALFESVFAMQAAEKAKAKIGLTKKAKK